MPYFVPMSIGIVSIVCIVISITIYYKSNHNTSPILFSSEVNATVAGSIAQNTITVDIQGAVNNPGVYTLQAESRVEDVIREAGGLTQEADSEKIAATINRAAKVVDGGKLFIPKIGQQTQQVSGNNEGVNVNSAAKAQLEGLAGIGEVTAQKIIDGRPYQTLDELVVRKIIFKSTFEKIKDQLTL